jgi:hypothetical protein
MANFFIDYFGETLGPILGGVFVLAIAAGVIWLGWMAVRRMSSGLFVSRTKGRAARLMVTDAAPVDSHRRLVLVRRDDVEHLIMIGGPTDIVIESGIGKAASQPSIAATVMKTPAVAAREAVHEAERGRPVRLAAQPEQPPAAVPSGFSVADVPVAATVPPAPLPSAPAPAAIRPPVAPPVFPEASAQPASAPSMPAPSATSASAAMAGQRAEPSFSPQDPASAASKASAELDRILAEIELSRAPTR